MEKWVYNELETYRLSCSIVGAKGGEEAAENRNYLASRMTEEVTEMIRVLQVMNSGRCTFQQKLIEKKSYNVSLKIAVITLISSNLLAHHIR